MRANGNCSKRDHWIVKVGSGWSGWAKNKVKGEYRKDAQDGEGGPTLLRMVENGAGSLRIAEDVEDAQDLKDNEGDQGMLRMLKDT